MKINTLLSIFAPKDGNFYPLFIETAEVMVQASIHLHDLFNEVPSEERVKDLCKLIKAEEVQGDKITSRILKALNETFITPFDREDIFELTDQMDDVIDGINRAAHKVLLYSPHTLPEAATFLAEIIKKGAMELDGAAKDLSNLKKNDKILRVHCKEIKNLEEQADVVYETGIMKLFKEEKDTVELIKQKEIIQELEKTVNKINNAGKVLKTISVNMLKQLFL